MATKNTKQVLKLLVHAAIVLAFTAVVVIAYLNGALNEHTQVPDSVEKLLSMVMSTFSFYVALALLAIVAIAHKWFDQRYQLRGKIRKGFFYILAFFTGKLYWWAGLCFGMWVLGWYVSFAKPHPWYLVLGFSCWLVGLTSWTTARMLAFKWLRGKS